jgi:hypothetical protein
MLSDRKVEIAHFRFSHFGFVFSPEFSRLFPESKRENVPDHPSEAKVSRIRIQFSREFTFRDGYLVPEFLVFNARDLRREYSVPPRPLFGLGGLIFV